MTKIVALCYLDKNMAAYDQTFNDYVTHAPSLYTKAVLFHI